MKILLTGGAGFIGSHIADLLIEEGHDIAILDDLSNGKAENINPKATFYHLNILDKKLADIFKKEGTEIVIHHAAQISVRDSVKNPIHDMEIKAAPYAFAESPLVRRHLDLPAVAEPCALLAGRRPRFILRKTTFDGLTVALTEESCMWSDSAPQTPWTARAGQSWP